MAKSVFISYSSHDGSLAETVCDVLERREIPCWIAPRDVLPGMVFDEQIIDAIDSTVAMIVILSGAANQSPYVKNELNRAFSKGKAIFTLRAEDVLPGKSLELYLATHNGIFR